MPNKKGKRSKSKHSKSYVSIPRVISNSRNKKLRVQPKGYDILGNIAVIEGKGSVASKRARARHIIAVHKGVKTVLAKASAIKGRYRTREFSHVLGEKNFVATYRENNCVFRFDVRKTYFSNRLSFERARIASLVKGRENVLVFFSGVGPFAIEIGKMNKKARVIAIELNRYASKMALENIRLNKLANVTSENGDVRKLSRKHKNFADRIIMPLPMQSLDFLDDALVAAKRRAVVHVYAIGPSQSAYSNTIERIREHAKKRNYKIRLLFKRVVQPYSPRDVEIVLDYLIRKR